MSRRLNRPLAKITIRIWQADWDLIQEMAKLQDVEPNRLLREMVHSYVNQSQALVRRNLDRLPPTPAFSMTELSDV